MKIKNIKIAWFRGSSDPIKLETNSRSLVVYGENGSGKSSFVDAVEYNIKDGKINHLSHEYSGRKQERAIINTHTPGSQTSSIIITLEDGTTVETKIQKNGAFTVVPDNSHIKTWDYRRTILRQNEVADFIADTKGDKYSALLPLLGLSYLEITAENLRKLEKNITTLSGSDAKELEVQKINIKRKAEFGKQAIYLDGRYEEESFEVMNPTTYEPTMLELKKMGVNYIAPPLWMLVTTDGEKIIPSPYALEAKKAGLKIITWSLERSGSLVDGGGWYYQSIKEITHSDGVVFELLNVLAQNVKIEGIFSDWPATVTYYANCFDIK